MKMIILGAICAIGLLLNTGCKSCGSCSKSACDKPAASACTGACCGDAAACAKCCKDEAGCKQCCKK